MDPSQLTETTSLWTYMGAAFAGGVILNVMPCVLPVLTMKVFHVIEHAGDSPRSNRMHGVAYTAGILATFIIFAAIIIVIRAGGDRFGWGMQFQSPAFVAGMTALVFAFALNALGVFEFSISVQDKGDGSGYVGSFFNGVVASVMSTPCSAPFLGSAAAFALGSGAVWWQTLLMFVLIGLGLAAPFLLISFVPQIGRVLPRPGPWMETFKHLMGFTLMAAAIWLLNVLQSQISQAGVTWFLVFLLVLAIALWSLDRFGGLMHALPRRLTVRLVAAALVAVSAWQLVDLSPAPKASTPSANVAAGATADHIVWAPFDPKKVQTAAASCQPVFIDFTADWCANCKANERLVIETQPIRSLLQSTQILPMKADWTNEDEVITKWLDKLGRAGIPAYAIYMPDGSHDLLPEVITVDLLSKRLKAAAEKYPASGQGKPCPKAG